MLLRAQGLLCRGVCVAFCVACVTQSWILKERSAMSLPEASHNHATRSRRSKGQTKSGPLVIQANTDPPVSKRKDKNAAAARISF
jgi:hypothetical protein